MWADLELSCSNISLINGSIQSVEQKKFIVVTQSSQVKAHNDGVSTRISCSEMEIIKHLCSRVPL